MKKQRIRYWIKKTHEAKVETERKLRLDIDKRVLNMRIERLGQVQGVEFAKRLRYYVKAYYAMDEADYLS